MSNDVILSGTKVAVTVETTEGVYAAPSATDYLEIMEAGESFALSREEKTRNVRVGNRYFTESRLGFRNAEVQIPVELKAGEVEGQKPQAFKLWESMGFSDAKSITARVDGTVDTSTFIDVAAGDITKFHKNDIVLIKKSGKDQFNVVKSVTNSAPNYKVELMLPLTGLVNGDTVQFAKSVMSELDETKNVTLSCTRYHDGNQIVDKTVGGRVTALEVSNFTTGEYPEIAATITCLDGQRELLGSPDTVTTSFQNSRSPLIVRACMFRNDDQLVVGEFNLSIAQTAAMKTSTCAENGKLASVPTGPWEITGSINPYKKKNALDFELDDGEYSLFVYAYNPDAVDGDKKQAVAFFIPVAKTLTIEDGDVDGLGIDTVSFKAMPSNQEETIKFATF